jgi:hypothetical protein
MPLPANLPTEDEEPRYRLAYDEAVRVLNQQRDDLGALQARALALLSAGTLATAFLGGVRSLGLFRTVVPPATPGEVITTGLPLWQLAILAGLFVALVVLWPTGEWAFQFDPTGLVRVFDTTDAKAATLAALYRDFAIRLDGYAKANGRRLELRVELIRAAIATLGVDVVVLLVFAARR